MADDRYTHGHHDAVLRSHRRRTAENSAQYLLAHLEGGQRLLDVGCGPGTLTADLASRVAPGPVVALDREAAVLAEAADAAAASGSDNVEFVSGDVYALDFDEASFDVVHAHQVLQHLTDPVAALIEMRRVVSDGGVVAARDADYAAMTWFPHDLRLNRWLEIYCQVARSNGAEPDAGRHLLSWANQAGFGQVEALASVWCFADEESRLWWGDLWADRMTDSAVGEQAQAERLTTAGELDDIAAAFRSWSERDDGWFAVVHGEILARR